MQVFDFDNLHEGDKIVINGKSAILTKKKEIIPCYICFLYKRNDACFAIGCINNCYWKEVDLNRPEKTEGKNADV